MKIAIPYNSLYSPLLAKIDEIALEHTISILRLEEEDCSRLLLNNSVDLALLSPLGYGRGVVTSDFRIIPTTTCMLSGWTGIGNICFAENLREVTRIASPNPTDFLIRAAHIILDEQYGISAEIEKSEGEIVELLKQFSAVITTASSPEPIRGLDISEEWEMAFGYGLPSALWVCRAELALELESNGDTHGELLTELTNAFAEDNLADREERLEMRAVGEADLRHGEILWRWNSEFEESLDQTLQLLYYRQLIREIPAVKLLGRD